MEHQLHLCMHWLVIQTWWLVLPLSQLHLMISPCDYRQESFSLIIVDTIIMTHIHINTHTHTYHKKFQIHNYAHKIVRILNNNNWVATILNVALIQSMATDW